MIDFGIIGGGISSLYTAYELLKKQPKLNIIILERNKHLGGRTWKEKFSHTKVVVGAGILRYTKDKLAIELINELNVPFTKSISSRHFMLPFEVDIKEIFKKLLSVYNKNPSEYDRYTFKKFGTSILGSKLYNYFRTQSGYTDYDNQNVYDTLYNYGFDDNYIKQEVIYVDWTLLIEALKDKLKSFENCKLYTNVNVKNIIYGDLFTIVTNKKIYKCEKIVSGTDITSFYNLFSNLPKNILAPYQIIKGQPFLLLYAKLAPESVEIMKKYIKGFTVCNTELNKIIPINPDDGVYLISYCDNKNAISLKSYVKNKNYLSKQLSKTLGVEEKIKILDLQHYYWENGTHYYKPFLHLYSRKEFFDKIRNPIKNLYIVGEMVAEKQGWVNGTLETTKNIYKYNS